MSVAAVLSHLRWTERGWFAASYPTAAGGDYPRDEAGGWGFDHLPVSALIGAYEQECGLSRRIVEVLDLGAQQEVTPTQFIPVNLRWILTHMIDETARHLGHLDILREQLDGTRGY